MMTWRCRAASVVGQGRAGALKPDRLLACERRAALKCWVVFLGISADGGV